MTSAPKRACIIGWPVEHSRSPLIHKYWLKKHGIEGDYVKEAVKPENFASFVKDLIANGYTGANVTVPHKQEALKCADIVDNAAKKIGAANTLWVENGQLHASNTDAIGYMNYLFSQTPDWNRQKRHCVVLGAGGAARAIIHGLLEDNASKIILCNRTRSKADDLAAEFGEKVETADWDQRSEILSDSGLLVNTTKLGMQGEQPLEIDLSNLPATTVVSDIVYVPLETDLILAAQARGNRTVDGLGMLLHQAVPGFEKWFGVRPTVTNELTDLVTKDLGL